MVSHKVNIYLKDFLTLQRVFQDSPPLRFEAVSAVFVLVIVPFKVRKNSDVNVLAIKTLNLIMLSTKTFERLVAFIHVVALIPVRRLCFNIDSQPSR